MKPPTFESFARQSEHFDRLAKQYGLASGNERLAGPARYRWDLIERDINTLLSRRRDLPKGKPGIIPDSVVNYIAAVYLGCCGIEKRPPSQQLVHLISEQLEVATFGLKAGQDEQLRQAQQLRADKADISNIAIAKEIGTNKATVGRWVASGLLAPRVATATKITQRPDN